MRGRGRWSNGGLRRDLDRLYGVVEQIVTVQERGLPVLAALRRRMLDGDEPPPPGASSPPLHLVQGGQHAGRSVPRFAAAVLAGGIVLGVGALAPDGAPLSQVSQAGASPTSRAGVGTPATTRRRAPSGGGGAAISKWGRQAASPTGAPATSSGTPAAQVAKVAVWDAGSVATEAPATTVPAAPTSTTLPSATTTTLVPTTTVCVDVPGHGHKCIPPDD